MALPESVRVKLSSEDAAAISITPVVVQMLPMKDLVELMLAGSGKDAARIADLLRRGSLVSGASRYRWEPLVAGEDDVRELLAAFPDPDSTRPFLAKHCVKVMFSGSSGGLEMTRETGSRKKPLRRHSFWERMLEEIDKHAPEYDSYSYQEKADVFRLPLNSGLLSSLRRDSQLLAYSTLARQLDLGHFDFVSLYVARARASR